MRGTCSTHEGLGRCVNGFDAENVKQTDHLEDRNIDVFVILKWISTRQDRRVLTGLI